jgi:hypothetical protein
MTLIQRVILSLICALALVSTPYSLAAQEQEPSQPVQQDRTDDTVQQDDADANTAQDSETDADAAADDEDLPETAGALPLLALIGAASLIGSRFARR